MVVRWFVGGGAAPALTGNSALDKAQAAIAAAGRAMGATQQMSAAASGQPMLSGILDPVKVTPVPLRVGIRSYNNGRSSIMQGMFRLVCSDVL